MFTMNTKKQSAGVFCSQMFFNIYRKTPVLESLFNQVTVLQFCKFIKRRFQHRFVSVDIVKLSKMHVLKKIYEQLLMNNVKLNHSSMKTAKQVLKCFSIFTGKHLYQSVLFNKYSCSLQLKSIFIQAEAPALEFS